MRGASFRVPEPAAVYPFPVSQDCRSIVPNANRFPSRSPLARVIRRAPVSTGRTSGSTMTLDLLTSHQRWPRFMTLFADDDIHAGIPAGRKFSPSLFVFLLSAPLSSSSPTQSTIGEPFCGTRKLKRKEWNTERDRERKRN